MQTPDELEKTLLGNAAEIQALRVALSKFDPNHPLLVSGALRQRIHAAGQRALGSPDAEGTARKAGASARY